MMPGSEILSFAADKYNSYPAEVVRFFVHPDFAEISPGGYIQVLFPPELRVENYDLANHAHGQQVFSSEQSGNTLLRWEWASHAASFESELVITTRVSANAPSGYLTSQVSLYNPHGNPVFLEDLRVKVNRLAESLKFLPEIYQRDDFTSRFLMLFESFWKPISRQIDSAYTTFDPYLTPPEFLPWLGSWFGLVLEDDLPEERKRDLLAQIAPIFAKRGTKQALITFLKMYTGGEVDVTEYIDSNLVLQNTSHLGYQMALGHANRPNSFDVFLQVPKEAVPAGDDEKLRRQQYARRVETLINMFKPAHTYFRLKIDFATK
jgi:phage tail-like protein